MYKAFLFDYDGVYTPGADNDWVYARLARNIDVPFPTAAAWLGEIWVPFLKGTMNEDEVWDFLESQYGKPIGPTQRDIWFTWDELKPHEDMVEEVGRLKAAGYTVGVLSNIFPNTKRTIEAHGGYDQFDLVVTSCDLGYKKPQPEIFQAALRRLNGIKPEEVVFLDDREPNANACEEHGMKGIHVTDHQQAIDDIRALAPDM